MYRGSYGDIWLHAATRAGSIDFIKAMEQYINAELLAKQNNAGRTAADLADSDEQKDLKDYLESRHAELDSSFAFWLAAKKGDTDKAQKLLESEAIDLMYRGSYGNSWLHAATKEGNIDFIKAKEQLVNSELLAMENNAGQTFLHLVAQNQKDAAMIDIWLHAATRAGSIDFIKAMEQYINAELLAKQNNAGRTAADLGSCISMAVTGGSGAAGREWLDGAQ
eukprot:TRINITY_DN3921_c0_g1_i5.p1 TRINITY_DN3921_c0_g1~~TRINITY_DN3921_c0_g1_i5.p1  ORF type:complete len:222 (+),score=63.16 TRINITY_DN3921_c0_g1_i5:3-668(+)